MKYDVEPCKDCKHCHKKWDRDKWGNFTIGYYGCFFLPYWGKRLEDIKKCPKYNADGTENIWTLKSVCKVND